MSHKVALVPQNGPYSSTRMPMDRSIEEIRKMLKEHNCQDITVREAVRQSPAGPEPLWTLGFYYNGEPYVLEFPVIYERRVKTPNVLRMEVSGRIVANRVKAMLIDVDLGVYKFEQTMIGFRALSDGTGHGVMALQEAIIENPGLLRLGAGPQTREPEQYSRPQQSPRAPMAGNVINLGPGGN